MKGVYFPITNGKRAENAVFLYWLGEDHKLVARIIEITHCKTTTTSLIKSYPPQANAPGKMFSFSATLLSIPDNVQSGTHICTNAGASSTGFVNSPPKCSGVQQAIIDFYWPRPAEMSVVLLAPEGPMIKTVSTETPLLENGMTFGWGRQA